MDHSPNFKAARTSDILRSQQTVIRQQDELIEVLKGALAAAGVSGVPAHEPWMSVLSRQERALVGILYARYPRVLPRVTILDLLPSLDHAHERQLQIVDTVVHKVRRKLGKDTVVTERGEGFRLGAALHEQLQNLGLILV